MTTQIQPNISSELEALRKRIAQLERRVTRLEEERDEARQNAVGAGASHAPDCVSAGL